MGAPVATAAALARTRTGRRIATGTLIALLIVSGLLLSPAWLIPLAVAGSTTPPVVKDATVAPPPDGAWVYPLQDGWSNGRGFGWNPVRNCAYCPSDHEGTDMSSGCGGTIRAVASGEVINAGPMPGWGNTVRIDHGDRTVTLYGHMQWSSLLVAVGDQVSAGDPVGLEGTTGISTGCHLHFEVQVDGVAIDPEPFMAARGLPLR